MQDLLQDGKMCDLILRAGTASVVVHSCVLAAHCPHFTPHLQQLILHPCSSGSQPPGLSVPLSAVMLPVMQLGDNSKKHQVKVFVLDFSQIITV